MLLQPVDLLPEREVAAIHYSRRRHRSGAPIAPGETAGSIVIPADTQLTFDRYLSAFYESWWAEFTALEHYRLELVASGRFELGVHRQCGNGEIHLLERRAIDADGPTRIDVKLATTPDSGIDPGRVWFTIDAHTEVTLDRVGWHTDQSPQRDVRLNVVFCTFNREDYLSQILRDIDRAPAVVADVDRVTVVNQGNPFDLARLGGQDWSEEFRAKVAVVEQPNLGGCGGFTRGMVETLQDPELDHFILLDDDIRIDPGSLSRARALLAFAHDDVAVGGHMIDLDRPTSLYESGADIHPGSLENSPINHGLSLVDDGVLEKFLAPRTCNYNGWWFFGASTDLLHDIGLPMPCFIRGDDVEYGVRLERSGRRTVAMPGIAVWHEPFYLKLGGWQLYFEVRNRLAMASIHGIGDWQAIRTALTKVFIRDLVLSRYHSCTFLLDAIDDYLAGPEQCFVTTPDALQRCRAIHDELGPTKVENSMPTRRPVRGPKLGRVAKTVVRARKAPQLAGVLAHRLRTGPTEVDEQPYAPGSIKLVEMAKLASYQVREGDGSTWRFDWDRDIERELTSRFAKAIKAVGPNQAVADAAGRGRDAWHAEWEQIFAELG